MVPPTSDTVYTKQVGMPGIAGYCFTRPVCSNSFLGAQNFVASAEEVPSISLYVSRSRVTWYLLKNDQRGRDQRWIDNWPSPKVCAAWPFSSSPKLPLRTLTGLNPLDKGRDNSGNPRAKQMPANATHTRCEMVWQTIPARVLKREDDPNASRAKEFNA